LFHDQLLIKEIREEIKKFLEFNKNESTYPNLSDTTKAILRRKFIAAMSAHIKNTERSQIYLMLISNS
jgi:hypothetical protein